MDFSKYFKERILDVEQLPHKGNNLLYKIHTKSGEYLLKQYSELYQDHWNKAKNEFDSVSILHSKGFKVPRAIKFDDTNRVGIYSFEPGRILMTKEIHEPEMLEMARFLIDLRSLDSDTKKLFNLERTKSLSIAEFFEGLNSRCKSLLDNFEGSEKDYKFLNEKVVGKIKELYNEILGKIDNCYELLPLEQQVVTPGDFGFHNALYENGKFTFIDFEYCGRDDPAKKILDFFHHDKNRHMSRELKEMFFRAYTQDLKDKDSFIERTKIIDPLMGLNWTLIYLNVLSKKYQKHLAFSGHNIEKTIGERVKKAEEKLKNLSFFIDKT